MNIYAYPQYAYVCVVSFLTLQLRPAEILEDLLPVGWVVIAAQIGLQLARQNFECSTFADTVGADQTQYLARPRHWQTVQLEAVGRVAMRDLCLEIGGQVDDVDSVEGAFFWADATANAQALADEGDLTVGSHLDAQLTRTNHRARLLTFLFAFARLAPVRVDDGNATGPVSPLPSLNLYDMKCPYRVSLSAMIFLSGLSGGFFFLGWSEITRARGRGWVCKRCKRRIACVC